MSTLQTIAESLKPSLEFFEVLLIVTAIWITINDAVKQVIWIYRMQSLVLALVTALTALLKLAETPAASSQGNVWLVLGIALLPLILYLFIEPLLARASLTGAESNWEESKMILAGVLGQFRLIPDRWQRFHARYARYLNQKRDAETVWIERKFTPNSQRALFVLPVLLLISFLVPFRLAAPGFDPSMKIGLAVSLALHLVGLYNMSLPQRDIISQVIGLLVMDHGLYLAVVKIVAIPAPAIFFVISLYFYTMITVFILVFLLPQLRRLVGSIEQTVITDTSLLKDA